MNADRTLRVLVVDDHDVVHWGFRLMLGEQPWVERFLSARSGDEALELGARYEPHVALVDLFLGDESGRRGLRAPARRLAGHEGPADLRRRPDLRARRARRRRLGLRRARTPTPRAVAAAVRLVGLGGTVFEPAATPPRDPCRPHRARARGPGPDRVGRTNREIAAGAASSPRTPSRSTRASIYRKLEVRNRAEAVQRAQRLGLHRLSGGFESQDRLVKGRVRLPGWDTDNPWSNRREELLRELSGRGTDNPWRNRSAGVVGAWDR